MSMRLLFAGLTAAGLFFLTALVAQPAAPPCDAPQSEDLLPTPPPPSGVEDPLLSAAPALGTAPLTHKVYPVADLIVPLAGTAANSTGNEAPVKTQEERLIRLIQSTISPSTWSASGGAGNIDYYPIGMALVVRQTADVQEEVADLLASLRRLQDVEVAVELRFLTVSDECLAKLGVAEGSESETRMLDDAQVRLLLETVQRDPRSMITQAPKMTVFNGQKAMLDLSEKQCFVTGIEFVSVGDRKVPRPETKNVTTGLHVSVLPVVAPDNRTVALQLGMNLARTDAPKTPVVPLMWTIQPDAPGKPILMTPQLQPAHSSARSYETTVKMSDGATALLSGWTHHHEVRNLVAAPVLSKIPYINQFFQNVSYGKEREHLLVLVTPRVLVRHESEPSVSTPKESSDTVEPGELAPEPPAPNVTSPEKTLDVGMESHKQAVWNVASPLLEAKTSPMNRVESISPSMHVHRRSFRLDYALDNVGQTGVSKLAVWYTRDASVWTRYDQEVPAKGHATITVPEDGRWGFTMIAYSGAGLSTAPPKPGEQPQVWVQVDTLAPQVALLSAATSLTNGESLLRVQYRSEDARLKTKPVTISYAPAPHGPWTVLAKGLPGSDQFSCSLEGMPHEFFVRVAAEDQAGNVGEAVSARLQADLKIPKVREVKVKIEE